MTKPKAVVTNLLNPAYRGSVKERAVRDILQNSVYHPHTEVYKRLVRNLPRDMSLDDLQALKMIIDVKLRDAVEDRRAVRTFPLFDRPTDSELASLGMTENGVYRLAAVWTGEERLPKAGEWFLAGINVVQAYRAENDMTAPYLMARLVRVPAH